MVEELITDVEKPEIMVMVVIVGGELFLPDYSDHPRKLVTLNPKLKSTGADATSFFPVAGDGPSRYWPERLLFLKSCGRCGIAAD